MLAVCGGSHDNGNSSVIVSLDGSRLFVANAGNNSVSVFSVDRNGANPTPLATFALSPDGKYVVVDVRSLATGGTVAPFRTFDRNRQRDLRVTFYLPGAN